MKQAILLLLILSFTAVCGNAAQTTNRKPCTLEEVNHALDESDRLKDWDAVYRFWKAYHGRCLSGPVWEGSADSIVRLLVRDWNHFVDFARLASNDEAFEEFVVNNISELASQEELSAIRKNASALCPTGQAELCKQIENEVGSVFSSLQESKSSLQDSNEVTLGVLEDLPGVMKRHLIFALSEPSFKRGAMNGNRSGPIVATSRASANLPRSILNRLLGPLRLTARTWGKYSRAAFPSSNTLQISD